MYSELDVIYRRDFWPLNRMVEAVICQVKTFFKKTIIKNHDFLS